MKTPDRNDLKIGTAVVLDTISKPVVMTIFQNFGINCHLANKNKNDYYFFLQKLR